MKKELFIFLLLFLASSAYAQQNTANQLLVRQYLSTAKEFAILYNGKEYTRNPKPTLNHPYLKQSDFGEGVVSFGGTVYPHVPILLDLYKDELVIQASGKPYPIIVEKERLDYAELYGYRIINPATRGWNNLGGNRYVLILHDGKYPVVKRYFIQYEEKVNNFSVEASYRIKEQYYVCVENQCLPVKSKGSLLKLFPDRKKELGQFIKAHKLNFRKNPEQAFVTIVKHYETLNR